MSLSLFDLPPLGFATVDSRMFGPSSRELRALNNAIGDWTSGLVQPAFAQLPVQQGTSTAMVSYSLLQMVSMQIAL